jgi:hypothetical protein
MKTNKAQCAKIGLVTEKFDPSEPAVTCTRCGTHAHDPSLLCSPSVTLASSTRTRESQTK